MKRVAANIILLGGCKVEKNAMVQVSDEGIVESIIPLSQFANEPSSTSFYNGVLGCIVERMPAVGDDLMTFEGIGLKVKDKINGLVLWKNISLAELVVQECTEELYL